MDKQPKTEQKANPFGVILLVQATLGLFVAQQVLATRDQIEKILNERYNSQNLLGQYRYMLGLANPNSQGEAGFSFSTKNTQFTISGTVKNFDGNPNTGAIIKEDNNPFPRYYRRKPF